MRINAHAIDVLEGMPAGLIENLIRNMDDTLAGRSKRKTVQSVDWRIKTQAGYYARTSHQIGFNAKEIRANAKDAGQAWTDIGDDWKAYLLQAKAASEARFEPRPALDIKLDRMAEMILGTYSERDRNDIIAALRLSYDLRVFYHELRLKLGSKGLIAKGAPSSNSWWEAGSLTITHLPETLVHQLVGTTPSLSSIIEADWAQGAHIASIRRSQNKDGGVLIKVA